MGVFEVANLATTLLSSPPTCVPSNLVTSLDDTSRGQARRHVTSRGGNGPTSIRK